MRKWLLRPASLWPQQPLPECNGKCMGNVGENSEKKLVCHEKFGPPTGPCLCSYEVSLL